MALLTTPVWTDSGAAVISEQDIAKGNAVRGTLDLSAKHGAYLMVQIGRGGTTALSTGVDVLVRRMLKTASSISHPGALYALNTGVTAAVSTTCATADSNAGATAVNVASSAGFAAGDIICISGGVGTRTEFKRVIKTAAGVLTLDSPLEFTHTAAAADTVRNQSFTPAPLWLPGGALYEVVFDYGDDAAGENVRARALVQTYDSDSTA